MRVLLCLLIFSFLAYASSYTHLKIDGAISPASSEHLHLALEEAEDSGSMFAILELNTPGGLVTSTRDMVQMIVNSNIPVVVYVSPKGSHAASAGTYILYSAHIAAMAPGTNLGAATPVSIMGGNPLSEDKNSAMEKKAIGDATAYIKSLSELRQRNTEWAIKAVTEGESISAKEALDIGAIDMIATDLDELLQKLDGYEVEVDGTMTTLETNNITINTVEPDIKSEILAIITNPNVAYILMLVAIYGIFFELMNPGSILPGAAGVISGVLALYALNILPFNYAGILLMFIGIAFMVAEVLVAGFGILGFAGVIAFVTGSLLLFDAQTLGQDISLALILAFALVSLGFFIYVMRLYISTKKQKPHSGVEDMIGSEAKILQKNKNSYLVLSHGERWEAVSKESFEVGEIATIKELNGLTLTIKHKE
ncbi:MAG: NfeD family protein [Campylobacterales bacterium]